MIQIFSKRSDGNLNAIENLCYIERADCWTNTIETVLKTVGWANYK